MTLWNAEPPQGNSVEQELVIIGRSPIPRFLPPQGLGAVEAFLLDKFPGAAAAYSLRQLRTKYLGPAIRVRRTSDNMEQDIGFLANGNLDVASMASFVGVSDGQIKFFYDQSGNDIHLDAQTDSNKFPRIIIAGVLQLSNALPSMLFDGANDTLRSTNSLVSPASHLFVFGVWQKTDLLNDPLIFNLQGPNVNPNRVVALAPLSSGVVSWQPGNFTTELLESAPTFNDILQHVWSFIKTAGTDNQKIKQDGIQIAQKTQASSSTILQMIEIGSLLDGIANQAKMQFQELVFYDINKSSTVVNIENNLINYWQAITAWVDDLGNTLIDDLGNTVVFDT